MCFKYRRILHHDVSRNKILIDPEHNNVKEFSSEYMYEEAKSLGHILHPERRVNELEDGEYSILTT